MSNARTALALAVLPVFSVLQFCPPEDTPPPSGEPGCPSCWRSELYPEDWTPDYTTADGLFLHDFSYAGYRYGEVEPPADPGLPVLSVLDEGADATGQRDTTAAIQATIDAAAAAGGGVVYLPRGTYLIDGLLTVRASNIVVRGDGPGSTRLVFTRSADMSSKRHLTFVGGARRGVELPLVREGVSRSKTVYVEDASELAVGDDVQIGWVISDAFVAEHSMDGTWQAFNGQWKTFFQRTVVSIDRSQAPHAVELDVPLRYTAKLRDAASLRVVTGYLEEVGVEDLSVTTAVDWDDAWENNRSHAIGLIRVKDSWVRRVHSFDSPWSDDRRDDHLQSGGIYVLDSKRVTVADCVMQQAQSRGGGGNGYLFELSRCSDVLVRDCVGRAGRHNFVQNWDFGTTGCVFLRTESYDGRALTAKWDPVGQLGCSEFHHSLAMANLIDDSRVDDCWAAVNRNDYSSGAGLSATESVFWRLRGEGKLRSFQAGMGYVIGTTDVDVDTKIDAFDPFFHRARHSEPEDYREGIDSGKLLRPLSLYEDQQARRLGL